MSAGASEAIVIVQGERKWTLVCIALYWVTLSAPANARR